MDTLGEGSEGLAEIEWRELKEPEELRAGFALRHHIYDACGGLKRFLSGGPTGIDFEACDLRSLHYGLHLCVGDRRRLVGSARFHLEGVPVRHDEIRAAVGELATADTDHASDSFALLRQFPEQAEAVRRFLAKLRARRETVVEAGRVTLEPDLRALSVAGRPLGRVLLELVVATGLFALPARHAVFACRKSHLNFYRRFGFDVLEDTRDSWDLGLGVHCVLVHGEREAVPAAWRPRLESIAATLSAVGIIRIPFLAYLEPEVPDVCGESDAG